MPYRYHMHLSAVFHAYIIIICLAGYTKIPALASGMEQYKFLVYNKFVISAGNYTTHREQREHGINYRMLTRPNKKAPHMTAI